MMGLRKFQEMVFTGRPFTAKEMYDCNFVNSVVPRDQLEAEVMKYATACSNTRPTDVVMMQKTLFEVFKQNQGEYMGSILTAWLESMLPVVSCPSAKLTVPRTRITTKGSSLRFFREIKTCFIVRILLK